VHICNPATQRAEIGGSWFEATQKLVRSYLEIKPGVAHICNSDNLGGGDRTIEV
jgi:hypothetical protein